jgi:hypothetical protein
MSALLSAEVAGHHPVRVIRTQSRRWPVERSESTVAGGVDLAAMEPGQFMADQPVMLGQQNVLERGELASGHSRQSTLRHRSKRPMLLGREPHASGAGQLSWEPECTSWPGGRPGDITPSSFPRDLKATD